MTSCGESESTGTAKWKVPVKEWFVTIMTGYLPLIAIAVGALLPADLRRIQPVLFVLLLAALLFYYVALFLVLQG